MPERCTFLDKCCLFKINFLIAYAHKPPDLYWSVTLWQAITAGLKLFTVLFASAVSFALSKWPNYDSNCEEHLKHSLPVISKIRQFGKTNKKLEANKGSSFIEVVTLSTLRFWKDMLCWRFCVISFSQQICGFWKELFIHTYMPPQSYSASFVPDLLVRPQG